MFEYRPAILDKTSVLIGIAGPTGSGKTYSALRLAAGLKSKSGRIGFIDTEAGRALHYARYFEFQHGILKPPFTPEAYAEAVEVYEKDGFEVIIIDSMTHEYSGEGGLQEQADQIEAGGVKSPGNWNAPKTAHKRMVNRFLQCRAHLIFCLRAEEKIKIERVNGKTVVVPVGFKPITEKNFMFEQTVSFMLLDSAPGVPVPIKLQDQHKSAFPTGDIVTETSGQILAAWANSGSQAAETPAARTIPLVHEDGSIGEFTRASYWLDGLREAIDACNTPQAAQIVWEENHAVMTKIGESARSRGDAEMMEAWNATGKYALDRIGIGGTE